MNHRAERVWVMRVIRGAAIVLATLSVPTDFACGQAPPPGIQSFFRERSGIDGVLPLPQLSPLAERTTDSFISRLSSNDAMVEVIVGQGRLLTLDRDIVEPGRPSPLVATGDPTVIDFEVVGPRHIRVTGQRIGVTDLSIIPSVGDAHNLEVHVVADLDFLRARLRQTFPGAMLELAHLREHVIVEGQARDSRQVAQIVQMITVYLESVQVAKRTQVAGGQAGGGALGPPAGMPVVVRPTDELPADEAGLQHPRGGAGEFLPEFSRPSVEVTLPPPQVINLIRLPGPQQVQLKVQVAELNRTALRQLGVNFLVQNRSTAIGSNISGGLPLGGSDASGLLGLLDPLTTGSTAFGVFDGGNVNFFVDALRRNQVFKILAEPTLVAMHGHEASFLSGGEFPIPVPQGGVAVGAITIQYREFGVGLTFVPYILDDETIRLSVAPEVSSIDFNLGIIQGGIQVPALNTRRTRTVVELQQGQTLAVSGLLQVEMEANTSRIPGLGDLPHIGALFRNNSGQRVEKELVILVTPYLVHPLPAGEVLPLPGEDVCEATDHEFFFKGRIEGRTAQPFRSTTHWDDSLGLEKRRQLESVHVSGPYGYSH